MKLPLKLKKRIVEALKPLDPEGVFLFGSYARGNPGKDSDIDLYVITKDEFMPQSFTEKNAIYLNVARKLYDIEKEIPVDLIVHTREMNRRFIEMGGGFSRNIVDEGIRLL